MFCRRQTPKFAARISGWSPLLCALWLAAFTGCAALPERPPAARVVHRGLDDLLGTYRVEVERVGDRTYLDTGGLKGVMRGPASGDRWAIPTTEPHHLAVARSGPNRLRFTLASRGGVVVEQRELAVELGDDGHAYATELGAWGAPFLMGLVIHGQIRLSQTDVGALSIEHAQSVSGGVLLIGFVTIDSERAYTGRFRRVSYKALQVTRAER